MDFMQLIEYLARWGHYLFGITWIGLLYYFNFVQGGYMAQATDDAKVDAFTKLVPSALWWFRFGALFTFLTGLLLILFIVHGSTGLEWSALSVGIVLASVMATLMFLNVWLIIWPNQKIVIASNESVRDGGRSRFRSRWFGGERTAGFAYQHVPLRTHAVPNGSAHALSAGCGR